LAGLLLFDKADALYGVRTVLLEAAQPVGTSGDLLPPLAPYAFVLDLTPIQ